MDAINAHDISTDVMDLLVVQLSKLAPLTQDVLKVAACLGMDTFDLDMIAWGLETTRDVVSRHLEDARRAGLVSWNSTLRRMGPVPVLNELRSVGSKSGSPESADYAFNFVHDRVQQGNVPTFLYLSMCFSS